MAYITAIPVVQYAWFRCIGWPTTAKSISIIIEFSTCTIRLTASIRLISVNLGMAKQWNQMLFHIHMT